jgi:hypothetical protein
MALERKMRRPFEMGWERMGWELKGRESITRSTRPSITRENLLGWSQDFVSAKNPNILFSKKNE